MVKTIVLMGLFGFGRKKEPGAAKADPGFSPYKDEALNHLYNLLFCDRAEAFRPQGESAAAFPWDILFADNPASSELEKLLHDTSAETRLRVLAANQLRAAGIQAPSKMLLGVVIEVGLDGGLDTLAAYADGSARYINQSGKMIIWDAKDETLEQLKGQLFDAAKAVVEAIGPHDGPRWPFPQRGNVRLSFFVSDGLYFGQSTIDHFFRDPMAGPVLHAGTQVMQFLVNKAG